MTAVQAYERELAAQLVDGFAKHQGAFSVGGASPTRRALTGAWPTVSHGQGWKSRPDENRRAAGRKRHVYVWSGGLLRARKSCRLLGASAGAWSRIGIGQYKHPRRKSTGCWKLVEWLLAVPSRLSCFHQAALAAGLRLRLCTTPRAGQLIQVTDGSAGGLAGRTLHHRFSMAARGFFLTSVARAIAEVAVVQVGAFSFWRMRFDS